MHRRAGRGLLLVMIEITKGNEDEFDRWYEMEHLPDRANCPGFLSARRFFNLREGSEARYLALYDLETPAVLESEPYKRIFTTPWTERIRTFYERPSIRSVYLEVAPLGTHLELNDPDTIQRTANRGLVLELVEVALEQEEKLNTWYETVHLPAWRSNPMLLAARRFVKLEGTGSKWLARYDLKGHPGEPLPPVTAMEKFIAGIGGKATHCIYREIAPLNLR